MSAVRIATWNCRGRGYAKLTALVEHLQPDLAVVCEYGTHPAIPDLLYPALLSAGVVGKKCLTVAAFGPWKITPTDLDEPLPPTLLPVDVDGPMPF